MNRHLKTAFMVAPFLAVFGYIGADYYDEHKANQLKVVELVQEGPCDIINKSCILVSGEFKINISDKNGVTEVNSTFPLDRATLFLVDEQNNAIPYPLGMQQTPYYWSSKTHLRSAVGDIGERYKLRLIANIKGGQYISEFYTQTAK